jgi:opacity protein-like surface antigen
MKIKLLVAAAATVIAGSAMAQANPFEGFSAGVNVSAVGATTKVNGLGQSLSFGEQSIVPSLEIGYMYGVTKDFALGITATYDLTDTKAGSFGPLQFKAKDHYSINLKPGYVFNNSSMVYAIVGYNSIQGNVSGIDGISISQSNNGIGVGLGLQFLVDKNIYIKAEAQQITFSSKTPQISSDLTTKGSATVGTIGVGYKF